jgi:RNA polymerase sigma-70 factor (ECF subfamily)
MNTSVVMDEFLEKIEKHKDEFYRFVYRSVWDTGVADDVFSQAVLAAYENRHKYTPGTNFRAWMFRILTNKCFVANRETGRTGVPLESVSEGLVAQAAAPGYRDVLNDPDAFLDACGDEVHIAFRRLSTAERSCLLLRAAEKFSYQEIADTLEIPVGTVMTHLSRGRAKLRLELVEYARETGVIREYPRLLNKTVPLKEEERKECQK